MSKIKQKRQSGLFDEEFILSQLSTKRDPLIKLDTLIHWEIFRPILDSIFTKEPKGKGGRPHYDYILMFRILILQRLYNLSDEQMEYQIIDRRSFRRFLHLGSGDDVPDEKTIWLFRETLTQYNALEELFDRFNQELRKEGVLINSGNIIDATIVDVPRQRRTKEENQQLKEGDIPEKWEENKSMLRQKDCEAQWTKKNHQSYFGYKNHVKICKKGKFIKTYMVTPANIHDSQVATDLLDRRDANHDLYADSAYQGKEIAKELHRRHIRSRIHEKAARNRPLTEEQKDGNKKKSKVRARIEHVFGFMENSMNGIFIRCVGLIRAGTAIGLLNLSYNMKRYIQLQSV